VELEQSPYLNVLNDNKVSGTLGLMGRSPTERVNETLGREICLRTRSKALLAGSIASLGSHYAIALKAVNCQTGDSLGAAEAEAESREKVLQALGQAASTMRGKLGESLASIQKFDKPLDEATTSSLDALQAFSEARRITNQKGPTEALPLLKHAIELDPNFARAYASLGTSYANMGQANLAMENFTKAYQLRERVSEREKFYIASTYYTFVTGEIDKANQQFDLWIHDYPRDDIPHANLGNNYGYLGEYEKAAAETREELRAEGDVVGLSNLGLYYLALDRLDEAQSTYQRAVASKFDAPFLQVGIYYLAFLQDDLPKMQQLLSQAMGKPGAEDWLLSTQSDTEAYHGRLQKSRQLSAQAVESAKRSGTPETAALWQANEARRAAAAALALAPGRDVRVLAALALARAGDAAEAQRLLDRLNSEFPLNTLLQNYWLPAIAAEIDLSRDKPESAVKLLQAAIPYELGEPPPFQVGTLFPAYVRGQAYLRAKNGDAAAAEFQKILNHRGIIVNFPLASLAHLGVARAYGLRGDNMKSRAAYQDFLALWKDADPDIPVLKEAKAEYAKVQ
jgi:tetratricopeptide (TPR) repeat protein